MSDQFFCKMEPDHPSIHSLFSMSDQFFCKMEPQPQFSTHTPPSKNTKNTFVDKPSNKSKLTVVGVTVTPPSMRKVDKPSRNRVGKTSQQRKRPSQNSKLDSGLDGLIQAIGNESNLDSGLDGLIQVICNDNDSVSLNLKKDTIPRNILLNQERWFVLDPNIWQDWNKLPGERKKAQQTDGSSIRNFLS